MMQSQQRRSAAAVALATVALFAGSARADFFSNTTGLGAPDQTFDFEGVALSQNQPVSGQFAGLLFENAFANADMTSPFQHVSGNRVGNFRSDSAQNGQFAIHFQARLNAVAFALATANNASTLFEAYLNGQLVEDFVSPTEVSNPENFYGFTGIVFDEIRLTTMSTDRALILDNLQLVSAPVPEPATLALLLGGVGLLGFLKRRA